MVKLSWNNPYPSLSGINGQGLAPLCQSSHWADQRCSSCAVLYALSLEAHLLSFLCLHWSHQHSLSALSKTAPRAPSLQMVWSEHRSEISEDKTAHITTKPQNKSGKNKNLTETMRSFSFFMFFLACSDVFNEARIAFSSSTAHALMMSSLTVSVHAFCILESTMLVTGTWPSSFSMTSLCVAGLSVLFPTLSRTLKISSRKASNISNHVFDRSSFLVFSSLSSGRQLRQTFPKIFARSKDRPSVFSLHKIPRSSCISLSLAELDRLVQHGTTIVPTDPTASAYYGILHQHISHICRWIWHCKPLMVSQVSGQKKTVIIKASNCPGMRTLWDHFEQFNSVCRVCIDSQHTFTYGGWLHQYHQSFHLQSGMPWIANFSAV